MWSYTWHPRGRCHCHICSTAFSVKLFDGQRGIFDRTVETLHECRHHPGPLRCWNCLQHHSQILHHKCHYINGRKICHWGFAFATPWLFPLHLFDRSLKICSLPLHGRCDCRYRFCGKYCWLVGGGISLPGKISIRTNSLKCLLISSTSVTPLFTKSWILVITLVSTAWLIPLAWVRIRIQSLIIDICTTYQRKRGWKSGLYVYLSSNVVQVILDLRKLNVKTAFSSEVFLPWHVFS